MCTLSPRHRLVSSLNSSSSNVLQLPRRNSSGEQSKSFFGVLRSRLSSFASLAFVSLLLPLAISVATANAQTTTTLPGSYSGVFNIAVDSSGSVYLASLYLGQLYKIPAGCVLASCVTTINGGFTFPDGVAVDSSGNIYVTDGLSVKRMPVGCTSASCVTLLGGGFTSLTSPSGIAVDSSGNVYVAQAGISTASGQDPNPAVMKIPPNCTSASCMTALGGGFSLPSGVSVDTGGNVYVTNAGNNAVDKIPAGCTAASCVVSLGGGFSRPGNAVIDGSGNLYVTDYDHGLLKTIPPSCTSSSCVTTLAGNFKFPSGLAIDGNGNIYVSDAGNFNVVMISSGKNFTITPSTGTTQQTVTHGQSASFPFIVGPPSGGSFPGSVTFTATGLPNGATATFSPSFVGQNAGTTTVTMTVQTSATASRGRGPLEKRAPLALAVLFIPMMGWKRSRRGALLAVFLLCGITALNGCGSGNSGGNGSSQSASTGSYTIKITASSGTAQYSTSVILIVQ
jgi:sugar lactone lactonase YvrE